MSYSSEKRLAVPWYTGRGVNGSCELWSRPKTVFEDGTTLDSWHEGGTMVS